MSNMKTTCGRKSKTTRSCGMLMFMELLTKSKELGWFDEKNKKFVSHKKTSDGKSTTREGNGGFSPMSEECSS